MNDVSTEELRAMLTDPDPQIRRKAQILVLLPVSGYPGEGAEVWHELDVMLTDPDPAIRQRARDACRASLDGDLNDHIQVLLEILADDDAVDAWPGCAELLGTVGPSGMFDFLVTVLAKTTFEGLAGRLAAALGLPGGRDLPRFTTEQAGENACVTCRACTPDATGPAGGDDTSHAVPTTRCARVSALVALLGSRHDHVQQRAARALAELGPGVTGVLRTACRAGTASRRGALEALTEIGWHELDPADRDLLTRLIRSQQPAETLAPLALRDELAAEWYAVPTTDQAAVLDAFDLCDPVPATMRMGLAPWSREDGWRPGDRTAYGETLPTTFEQVYVSPALDGWTLVFATYPTLDGGGSDYERRARAADARHRCWQLSYRFGAAHWYAQGFDGHGQHSGWCVYEDGDLTRYCYYLPVHFDLPEDEVLIGPTRLADLGTTSPVEDLRAWLAERDTGAGRPPPSPDTEPDPAQMEAEARLARARLGDDMYEMFQQQPPWPDEPAGEDTQPDPTCEWEFSASRVAWRLSVSPESFGPDMHMTGTGVIAVPRALRDRPRYGALPI